MSTRLSKLSVVVGVIVAAIALTIIYPQPANAQAQVIKQRFNDPVEFTFLATDFPCLTEDVHFTGTLPTQTQTTTDAKGGLHLKFQQIANLSAVGVTTLDTYHTQGPVVFVEYDFDGTAPREVFFHNLIQCVGPGQDGKFLLRLLFHLVVNANGVQTLEVFKLDVLCEGGGSV